MFLQEKILPLATIFYNFIEKIFLVISKAEVEIAFDRI
jgi:hypothetical protein